MPKPVPDFRDLRCQRPDLDRVRADYDGLCAGFDPAGDPGKQVAAALRWNRIRSRVDTARSLASVRYSMDTRDPGARADREFFDENDPAFQEQSVRFARLLLASPHRAALSERLGEQLFRIQEAAVSAFDPRIMEPLRREARLSREYTERLAAAEIPFRGETCNLSSLARHYSDADRAVRRAAQEARFGFFAGHASRLDTIYDELVGLRDGMARALGHRDFVSLAYLQLTRTDYGPAEVEVFRRQILRRVVPLAAELRRRQARRLGLDRLAFHDEAVEHPEGNPRPLGDGPWVVEQARQMYRAMGPETGEFIEALVGGGYLDVESRPGKAGGGFCTEFPDHRVPFVFANFNGTKADVEVMTHECGHAFQSWMSRHHDLVDYRFPTAEACEIHSMGMEFLTGPFMDRFFGEGAERVRRDHLSGALSFLPYAAAVDEFQHRVYREPGLGPAGRRAVWRELESLYLPWRAYEGLPHASEGGFWQAQRHIYLSPFYYIDYALAQTCALQLWSRSRRDPEATFQDYLALCRPGGSLPFLGILAAGRLENPFREGCLDAIVGEAARELGL
ncbi:MAG: M3 family oligoendopeptidase [Planctomycetes bacterium]|nr:M3 family oligoendopeptidase [Planctomycetota bacterium]